MAKHKTIAEQKAILRCGNKTDAEIRKLSDFPLTDDEVALIKATYDAWDGLECLVRRSFDGGFALLANTNPEQQDKVIEAMYLMEQDAVFGSYINDREGFERDLASGEYQPSGGWTFGAGDVELLEDAT